MTTLTLQNLTKEYAPEITAVTNLTLTVHDGELMALLGPSGCGKSTTLRLVAGLLQPTSGDVLFNGRSILSTPPEKRGAVMVFQEHALFPFMSVGDNVAYGLKMRKLGRDEISQRVAEALTAVQLSGFEDRWPDQLSGGQRQRVALARALVIRPRLLLLDEPLSSLDRSLREELRQMIRQLQQETGITTLFVTHDQAEAVAVADRIGVMMNGRIRQIGRPRDFYEQPADAQVARFFGANNFLPGLKQGQTVVTTIGPIEIPPTPLPDGPVLLTVRPEAIELGVNGHNNFPAQVQSCSFRVPAQECQVSVSGVNLHLIPPPYTTLSTENEIMIHLPRERICVLPSEGK
jgi:ABC-type Fe3+/spermidine/putrescine transport system ATPase subunit